MDKFPNLEQWWEEKPKDILTYIYWTQRQLPPHDPMVKRKALKSIVDQLDSKYPSPFGKKEKFLSSL